MWHSSNHEEKGRWQNQENELVLRTVVERNRDEKDEDGGYVQRHVEAESMFIGRKGKVPFLVVLLLSFLSF